MRFHPALLALLLCGLKPAPAHACTSIIVGRNASDDGSVFIARTVDLPPGVFRAQPLVHHPRRTQPALFRSNANRFNITLPAPGLAYHAFPLIPLAEASRGNSSFEESGINSAGVSISATETIMSSPKATAADPLDYKRGITEDAIASIILPHPRARTARGAAALLGEMITAAGSAEGFGVHFSDPSGEAWYLENGAGHHWLARRVPADSFFVSANQGRFAEVDLSDAANVMHSPGILEFTLKAGLRKANATKPFSFFKAFTASGGLNPEVNHARACALVQRYAGMDIPSCMAALPAQLPTFMPPKQPIGLLDVMEGLRDHFQGTTHDAYTTKNPQDPWRPVFVLHTSLGHVTRTRPNLPLALSALSVVNYVALGPPALAPFVPVYRGLPPTAYPAALTYGGATPDGASLYWKGRRLQALVMQDFPKLAPAAQAAIREFERQVEMVQRPAMEAAYQDWVTCKRGLQARKVLVDFTASVVARAVAVLDEQIAQAATQLGLPSVPSDDVLMSMLKKAGTKYVLYGAPSVRAAAAAAGNLVGAAAVGTQLGAGRDTMVRDTSAWPFLTSA